MDDDHRKQKEMVLKLDFGGNKSPSIMTNERLKMIEIYGLITPGSIHQIGTTPGGYPSVVSNFFSALLTNCDSDLWV
jgi:hypothetical protein